MILAFEKWHACQNDFIVCWLSQSEAKYAIPSLQRQAQKLCSRQGDGIGADGILVLLQSHKGETLPRELCIINHDGTLAKNCGNGLRCAAASILKRQELVPHRGEGLKELCLRIGEQEYLCQLLQAKPAKQEYYLAVAMGQASLDGQNPWHGQAQAAVSALLPSLKLEGRLVGWRSCELGNPHLVFFVEEKPEAWLYQLGPLLQNKPFQDGINVHVVALKPATRQAFAQCQQQVGGQLGESYEAVSWERGVGPTKACGSGACAIAAAVFSEGLLSPEHWLGVDMPGGSLYVQPADGGENLVLAGPAHYLFKGEVEL